MYAVHLFWFVSAETQGIFLVFPLKSLLFEDFVVLLYDHIGHNWLIHAIFGETIGKGYGIVL